MTSKENKPTKIKGYDHSKHTKQNIPDQPTEKPPETQPIQNEEPLPDNFTLPPELADKIPIEIKPREDYLKQKIQNSEHDPSILSSIHQNLELSNKLLASTIFKNAIHFGEYKETAPEIIEQQPSVPIEMTLKMRRIAQLKQNLDLLKSNLARIIENEKLLSEDSSKQCDTSTLSAYERTKIQQKLAALKQKKEKLQNKIEIIEGQIFTLLNEPNEIDSLNIKSKRIAILKDFQKSYKSDTKNVEEFVTHCTEDNINRKQNFEMSIEKMNEKIHKQELKDLKLQEKQKAKLKKLRNKHRKKLKAQHEKIVGYYKDHDAKIQAYLEKIGGKPEDKEYLFQRMQENYLKNEQKQIREKLYELKGKRSIPLEEIEANKQIKKLQFEEKLREIQLKYERQKESDELNQYFLPKSNYNPENDTEISPTQIKQMKIDDFKERKERMEIYSKEPSNEKQRKQDLKLIQEKYKLTEPDKYGVKKEFQLQVKTNQLEIQKRKEEKNQPKVKKFSPTTKPISASFKEKPKITWDLQLKYQNPFDVIEEQIKQNPKYKQHCKIIETSTEIKNKQQKTENSNLSTIQASPNKKVDYLKEQRSLRENKSNGLLSDSSKKWERMLKKSNVEKQEGVQNVKYNLDRIEEKVKRKEEFLKVNGINNYPNMSTEISTLLLDSIKGKLTLINNAAAI